MGIVKFVSQAVQAWLCHWFVMLLTQTGHKITSFYKGLLCNKLPL